MFLPALIVERVDEIQNSTDSHKSLLRLGDLVRLEFQSNHFSFLIKHNGSKSRLLARGPVRVPAPAAEACKCRFRDTQWRVRGLPVVARYGPGYWDVPSESGGRDCSAAAGGLRGGPERHSG